MLRLIASLDQHFIHGIRRMSTPLARGSLFVVFFWFGILKILHLSPATPLVESLFTTTALANILSFNTFLLILGIVEVTIGILFIFRGFERIAILCMLILMIATILPLFLLPEITWSAPWVPTLEGQYIIKNIVLVALATGIAAHLKPLY